MCIIIYGTSQDIARVSSGQFFCPHCATFTTYVVQQVQRHATLFFIPLFAIGHPQRTVVCERCQSAFDMAVLDPVPANQEDRILLEARQRLASGTSVGKVQARLEEAGYDAQRAEALVLEWCGRPPNRCECGRRYHPDVGWCEDCEASIRP